MWQEIMHGTNYTYSVEKNFKKLGNIYFATRNGWETLI